MPRNSRYWLGGLASLAFLAIFALRTDIGDAIDDLLEADYRYLVPAIAALFVSVWFRAWRWATILRALPVRRHRLDGEQHPASARGRARPYLRTR
jgi:uncharacterized membrane protein YbhN (UPF0104 family)